MTSLSLSMSHYLSPPTRPSCVPPPAYNIITLHSYGRDLLPWWWASCPPSLLLQCVPTRSLGQCWGPPSPRSSLVTIVSSYHHTRNHHHHHQSSFTVVVSTSYHHSGRLLWSSTPVTFTVVVHCGRQRQLLPHE